MTDRIINNSDGSVSVTLVYPITGPDGEISQVTLRRAKGKDIRSLRGASDSDRALNMVSQLSGIAPPFIDEMDGEDVAVLNREVGRFLGNSPETGGA
jgi:hypothetical protein